LNRQTQFRFLDTIWFATLTSTPFAIGTIAFHNLFYFKSIQYEQLTQQIQIKFGNSIFEHNLGMDCDFAMSIRHYLRWTFMKWSAKLILKKILFESFGSASLIRWFEWPRLLDYLNPQPNERILDLASGDGTLALKIAEAGSTVCGLDMAEDSVRISSTFSKDIGIAADFAIGNAEYLPFLGGCVDKVVCSSSLEHFTDAAKALNEVHRVLKKGGSIVLTADSLSSFDTSHKAIHKRRFNVNTYYSKETLTKLLATARIETCRAEYLLSSRVTDYFLPPILFKDYPGIVIFLISCVVFPICLVSERLFSQNNRGYSIIIEGRKIE
jgi:SAM-dependent methyltransferase